ncbi:MAG TPA: S9 family peptidase [Bryobacteraceae bacterium]|nr:S9 family peptidase [Bryobacteraceae bacterium]
MRTIIALAVFSSALIAQKHPITHEDVWLMKRVGAPMVSPDGKWAVTSVVEPSYDAAKTASDLWLVPLDGSAAPRRLTSTLAPENDAVFSPDSKRLAFATKREGDETDQIYILPLDGGEAMRVTNLSTGAANPQWRPDGKAILFQSRVYPGAKNDAENRNIAEERKARKYNARIFDGFPIRFWDHWLDDLRPHVFVESLEEGAAAHDLLAGTKLAALPGFEGELEESSGSSLDARWSPDGNTIVFTATTDLNRAATSPITTELYRVSAEGGEPVALTSGPDSYHNAIFRPDGKALYATTERSAAVSLYSLERLVKIDWPPAGPPKPLTASWDRSVDSIAFTPDSRTIYVAAEDQGHDRVFQLPADGGEVRPAFEVIQGSYSGLVIPEHAATPILVANWQSMIHPADVVRVDAKTGENHFLTEFNKERIRQIDWQPPREFWFNAKTGRRIQSLVVLPPAFDPAKKYPLLVFPHGGPHNMIKDTFFVRWNYHLLTSPGYVLLMTNYTGSTGYGEEFAVAIDKDVLRGPASEVEQAADEAIRLYPFIDATRQAAAGASYGGYLMNWFEGNTKRFKCLVSHAGLSDNTSFWGATDDSYYWEMRNGGPVWEQKGAWREQNPSTYAANFSTPMLVTQGERDFRVPVNQGLEMYKLLQRREVPSRLVVFPDENHWVLKGEDAREHMHEVLGWLAKYM